MDNLLQKQYSMVRNAPINNTQEDSIPECDIKFEDIFFMAEDIN